MKTPLSASNRDSLVLEWCSKCWSVELLLTARQVCWGLDLDVEPGRTQKRTWTVQENQENLLGKHKWSELESKHRLLDLNCWLKPYLKNKTMISVNYFHTYVKKISLCPTYMLLSWSRAFEQENLNKDFFLQHKDLLSYKTTNENEINLFSQLEFFFS